MNALKQGEAIAKKRKKKEKCVNEMERLNYSEKDGKRKTLDKEDYYRKINEERSEQVGCRRFRYANHRSCAVIPLQVLVVLLPSESSAEESFPTLGQSRLTWNVALAASSTDLWVGLHFARSPSGIHYHLNDALGADACLMRWCGSLCVCVSLSCGVERAESCNHSLTHLF